jgi:hypothetical protein
MITGLPYQKMPAGRPVRFDRDTDERRARIAWHTPAMPRRSFANCRAYGITKFSKNGDGAKVFLEALVDNYKEAAKASTGYNMPFLKNYAKPPP